MLHFLILDNFPDLLEPNYYLSSSYWVTVVYNCFLLKVVRQSHTDVMSFCMYFEKIGCICFYLFKDLLCSPAFSRTDPLLFPPLIVSSIHRYCMMLYIPTSSWVLFIIHFISNHDTPTNKLTNNFSQNYPLHNSLISNNFSSLNHFLHFNFSTWNLNLKISKNMLVQYKISF